LGTSSKTSILGKYALPLLLLNLSYIFTALISLRLISILNIPPTISVTEETLASSITTLAVYIIALGGGAVLLYFLIVKGALGVIKYYVFASFLVVIFLLTALEIPILLPYQIYSIGGFSSLIQYLAVAIIIVIMITLLSLHFFKRNRTYYFAPPAIYLCIMLASIFVLFFDAVTPIILLLAISAYDVFAVFVGPLKQVAKHLDRDEENNPFAYLLIDFGYAGLGLGDVLFYNIFIATVIRLVPNIFSIIPILFLDTGFIVTIYLLKYRRPLPALPIPIIMGLLSLLIIIIALG